MSQSFTFASMELNNSGRASVTHCSLNRNSRRAATVCNVSLRAYIRTQILPLISCPCSEGGNISHVRYTDGETIHEQKCFGLRVSGRKQEDVGTSRGLPKKKRPIFRFGIIRKLEGSARAIYIRLLR